MLPTPAVIILATAATVSARVFHKVPVIPHGWNKASPALHSDKVTLKIGLKQQHAAALEEAVLAVSTPGHPDYGKHLTREQLRAYVAPHRHSVGNVTSWLAGHGVAPAAVDNEWLTIVTDVETANGILDADFHWFEHEEGGVPRLRTLQYGVPNEVADHIDLVQPTTRFHQGGLRSTFFEVTDLGDDEEDEHYQTKQGHVASAGDSADADAEDAPCVTIVTPQCLRAQYNISYTPPVYPLYDPQHPDPHHSPENLVAFASYLEQYARYDDLDEFQELFLPEAEGQNFTVSLINAGLDDQASGEDSMEANLDLQYILGISHPIPVKEFSTGGRGPLIPSIENTNPSSNEPYLDFLAYILDLPDDELPQTLTTSYGEEEQSVPREFALKVCNMFMQLGGRGVSVLFSSGDSGPGSSCRSNTDNTTTTLQPNFPAGCPYVTSVGATTSSSPERGVSFSSGGFSAYHPRPAWQDAAVGAYLDSVGPAYGGLFDPLGRGIPDVAAQGQSFRIVDKGRSTLISGTSASSPVFAGVVALLNAARRSQGLSPLGFLNPWLYSHPDALLDITAGFSSGCRMGGAGLPASGARWNCTAGWDPVTGLGTPLFDRLLAAAAPEVEGDKPCPGNADGVACP